MLLGRRSRRPWPSRCPGRGPTRRPPWGRLGFAPAALARSCLDPSLFADTDGRGRPLEALGLPRGPQGDVDLVGAGVDVAPDLVACLLVAARQGRIAEEVGQPVELDDEVLVLPRQGDVDRALDLGRVASHVLAVAEEHLALAGELVGRHERRVPPVRPLGDGAQRLALAAAADPDRELGLHRAGLARGVTELEVLTV